jgi:hypothetical protein
MDSHYPISRSQTEALHRDGHLFLPGLVTTDEIAAFAPLLLEAAAREYRQLSDEERQLYMMMNLWERDAAVRRFVLSRRLARVAAELLDVPAVRLWRDVVFVKEAGETDTPWHQDRHWEPIDTPRFLGIWIALNDATPDMGLLRFAQGSHTGGRIPLPDHEGRSQPAVTEWIGQRYPIVTHAPLAAGDATVHLGWTLHSSPPNLSAKRREAFSIFYFDDGARIARWPENSDPLWARVQRHHLALRFPGCAQGDPGDSEHCPVVYRRE